jgi:pectate lyase
MDQPLLLLPLLLTSAFATPHDPTTHQALDKRASFPIPSSKGSVTYSSSKSISGTFDGGLKTYGRGITCSGQKEGGTKDAVFILKNGANPQERHYQRRPDRGGLLQGLLHHPEHLLD